MKKMALLLWMIASFDSIERIYKLNHGETNNLQKDYANCLSFSLYHATDDQFKFLYNHTYQAQFFKNPNSSMKKLLANNDIEIAGIVNYAHDNPNSRTAKILNQFK